MKTVTTPVLRRFGFRRTLLFNGMLTALVTLACAHCSASTARGTIMAVLFVNGLSRSMQFTSLNTLAYVDIPKPQMSSATSFSSMVWQMAMGMGVAVGAILLRVAELLKGNRAGAPTVAEFHLAFGLVALIALLATFDTFGVHPEAGAAIMGTGPGGMRITRR